MAASAGLIFSAFTLLHTQEWKFEAKDAKIDFTLPNGKHSGTVGGLNATFNFVPEHLDQAVIKATVDVKELKADNEKLTAHLMTSDFFDAENHPQISFNSEKLAKTDSGFVASGKLAMRDSVHTVDIPFTFVEDGNKAVFKGRLDIFAGDYGIGKKSEKGNDRVVVSIEVPVWHE